MAARQRKARSGTDLTISASPVVAVDAPAAVERAAMGGGLEGAERLSRETANWAANRRSPDQIINPVKIEADARGREMSTTDGRIQGSVHLYRDGIVGSQYLANSRPNLKVLKRIDKRFDDSWGEEFQEVAESTFNQDGESLACWFDAARRMTFTQMIRMGVASFAYTGEVLGIPEWVRDEPDRPFKTAVQVCSPDRLSNPNNEADRGDLRRGIRRDRNGRPLGAYIRQSHPSEFYSPREQNTWKYVPWTKPWGRTQVIHISDPMQPDQTRGISDMVAALKSMRMTKNYSEMMLQSAVINASYAATIESEIPSEILAAAMGSASQVSAQNTWSNFMGMYLQSVTEFTEDSQTLNGIDGAKIPHLFPGTKLNTRTIGTPGGIGSDFEASLLRHIAAALGLSYEEFARDFSKTNYSSARAAMNMTWKHLSAKKKFVADRLATEIFALWVEEVLAMGILPMPRGLGREIFYQPRVKDALCKVDWIGAARGQIDEVKETQAALLRIRGGLSTREQEIMRMGGDWREIFAQLEREEREAKRLGINLSADVTKDGSQDGKSVMNSTQDARETEDA